MIRARIIIDKGKVTERRRRKTMGLKPQGQDSQVAEVMSITPLGDSSKGFFIGT
jgi:hypothetical protein